MMNKLIFLIVTILLFNSCSNENDTINTPLDEQKKYTVNFKVKENFFEIESSQLRSLEDNDLGIIQMAIYDNTGKFILEQVYYSNTLSNNPSIINSDGSINFSVKLEEGNYYFTFIANKIIKDHPQGFKQRILGIENYFTHYYTDMDVYFINNQIIEKTFSYDNSSIYYETGEINLLASQQHQTKDVSLKPMWSYVKLRINDAQSFDVPDGTDALDIVISPRFYGFGIQNKLATLPYPKDQKQNIVSLNTIRANPTFELINFLSKTESQNNNLKVIINYLNTLNDSTYNIIETRELQIPQTSLENGYYYNINGNLGSKKSGQSMNISLGEFNKEDVTIEF